MMTKLIRINYGKVYNTGQHYRNVAETIREKQKELRGVSSEIESAWKGADSHNFSVSFNSHIDDLDFLIDYLDYDSEVLKGCSRDHNRVDNNFVEKMKRSDINA